MINRLLMILRKSFAEQTTVSIYLRFIKRIRMQVFFETFLLLITLTMGFLTVTAAIIIIVIVVVGIDTIVIVRNVIVIVVYV